MIERHLHTKLSDIYQNEYTGSERYLDGTAVILRMQVNILV